MHERVALGRAVVVYGGESETDVLMPALINTHSTCCNIVRKMIRKMYAKCNHMHAKNDTNTLILFIHTVIIRTALAAYIG